MKRIITLIAAMLLALGMMAGPAIADGAGQTSENANCVGETFADYNSVGGDREKGYFGSIQAPFVQDHQPYGEWLTDWEAEGC